MFGLREGLREVFSANVLAILLKEGRHEIWLDDANLLDQPSSRAHGIGSSREAEEVEVISRAVIGCDEVVSLQHILKQAKSLRPCKNQSIRELGRNSWWEFVSYLVLQPLQQ